MAVWVTEISQLKQEVAVPRSLYLCMWGAASRCRSPDTCSFRRLPWCSRHNTSTPPRPRTGTPPPAPPRWPHGVGGHRTPLWNDPRVIHCYPVYKRCCFASLTTRLHQSDCKMNSGCKTYCAVTLLSIPICEYKMCTAERNLCLLN